MNFLDYLSNLNSENYNISKLPKKCSLDPFYEPAYKAPEFGTVKTPWGDNFGTFVKTHFAGGSHLQITPWLQPQSLQVDYINNVKNMMGQTVGTYNPVMNTVTPLPPLVKPFNAY